MLHSYLQDLTLNTHSSAIDILNTDNDFNSAVKKCKNIIARYLALYTKPARGVDGGILSLEFSHQWVQFIIVSYY